MLIIITEKLKFIRMIKNYKIDVKFIRQMINLYILKIYTKLKNIFFPKFMHNYGLEYTNLFNILNHIFTIVSTIL